MSTVSNHPRWTRTSTWGWTPRLHCSAFLPGTANFEEYIDKKAPCDPNRTLSTHPLLCSVFICLFIYCILDHLVTPKLPGGFVSDFKTVNPKESPGIPCWKGKAKASTPSGNFLFPRRTTFPTVLRAVWMDVCELLASGSSVLWLCYTGAR